MKRLAAELSAAFTAFTPAWMKELEDTRQATDKHSDVFLTSYTRLATMQAWRSEILDGEIIEEALAFFVEAQNDGVVSHVQARLGCWRPALQALRSMIENTYQMLYYKDHPIELALWHEGKHRLSRSELQDYIELFPGLDTVKTLKRGIDLLSKQYACLNHAVHASSKSFRMTRETTDLRISRYAPASVSQWASNERDVILGINLVLLAMFRDHLQGARKPNLRKAISLQSSTTIRELVKADLRIELHNP